MGLSSLRTLCALHLFTVLAIAVQYPYQLDPNEDRTTTPSLESTSREAETFDPRALLNRRRSQDDAQRRTSDLGAIETSRFRVPNQSLPPRPPVLPVWSNVAQPQRPQRPRQPDEPRLNRALLFSQLRIPTGRELERQLETAARSGPARGLTRSAPNIERLAPQFPGPDRSGFSADRSGSGDYRSAHHDPAGSARRLEPAGLDARIQETMSMGSPPPGEPGHGGGGHRQRDDGHASTSTETHARSSLGSWPSMSSSVHLSSSSSSSFGGGERPVRPSVSPETRQPRHLSIARYASGQVAAMDTRQHLPHRSRRELEQEHRAPGQEPFGHGTLSGPHPDHEPHGHGAPNSAAQLLGARRTHALIERAKTVAHGRALDDRLSNTWRRERLLLGRLFRSREAFEDAVRAKVRREGLLTGVLAGWGAPQVQAKLQQLRQHRAPRSMEALRERRVDQELVRWIEEVRADAKPQQQARWNWKSGSKLMRQQTQQM